MQECGRCWGKHRRLKLRSCLWLGEGEREVLHKIKYGGRFELLSLFRESAFRLGDRFFEGSPHVVPIPLHPRRLRARGFNQSERLARWVARRYDLSVSMELKKEIDSAPQSTLTRRERMKNLRKSFVWRGRTVPERVLLVDDVLTTGATFFAAAGALRRASARGSAVHLRLDTFSNSHWPVATIFYAARSADFDECRVGVEIPSVDGVLICFAHSTGSFTRACFSPS